jgi:beta-glucosidase
LQVYVTAASGGLPAPRLRLADFGRQFISSGQSATLQFTLSPAAFAVYDDNGTALVMPGVATIYVGGGQPGTNGTVTVSTTTQYTSGFPLSTCV